MKRWKITFTNNKELLIYSNSSEQKLAKEYEYENISPIKSVKLYTDYSYIQYINTIKQNAKFIKSIILGDDTKEIYQYEYYKGTITIALYKDNTDGTYYDFAEYYEQVTDKIIHSTLKTMSTPKDVLDIIIAPNPQYIIYSHRYYGEPKLSKPKELKGIKSIGTAAYNKKCNPQIFIKDNDVYIRHTDYFSKSWEPPKGERIDMPLSYYMNKYFNMSMNDKFIYPDCWGDIVLRNEAWILLKDILALIKTEKENVFSQKILQMQKHDKYSHIQNYNYMEWVRFWEEVHKVCKKYLNDYYVPNGIQL